MDNYVLLHGVKVIYNGQIWTASLEDGTIVVQASTLEGAVVLLHSKLSNNPNGTPALICLG